MNVADHTGQTALHWSSVRGSIQVAEILLQEGARVSATDMNGYQVGISLDARVFRDYVASFYCLRITRY